MSELDALLGGIVDNPHDTLRWLVLADWLDDNGQPERAELMRLHRELLRTCTEPEAHPERPTIHARIMELMRAGATPCVPRQTLTLPGGVDLPMAFIPPGSFQMGSPQSEVERQTNELLHEVRLTSGFFLSVSPVTQAQWVAVMDENPSYTVGELLTVERVSCHDVQRFCWRVSELTGQLLRLPTEAEWEYAARAGTTTPYYWGEQLNGKEANCDGSYPYRAERGPRLWKPTQIGRYWSISPHAWGLVDMLGNVWERCADWYDDDYYPVSPKEDPIGPEIGSGKVIRGGSWNVTASGCRTALRSLCSPDNRTVSCGFRLAANWCPNPRS